MALVDYSDSSDEEVAPAVERKTTKPTFQKVVDRSNPGKIKVSLPQITKEAPVSDEPPTKKAKIGGGMSGFLSSLPAPKKIGLATSTNLGGGNTARKGLGSGVNLKTGAAPGFSREPEPEREYNDYNDAEEPSTYTGSGLNLPPPKTGPEGLGQPAAEVKLVGKPMMFKPLSVARNTKKKKKATSVSIPAALSTTSVPTLPQDEVKPSRAKVSMFALSEEASSSTVTPARAGEYKPMMYEVDEEPEETIQEASYDDYTPNASFIAPPAVPTPPTSQSLDDIAGDLNLTAAERRQLFGRGHKGGRATNVINFNTDQEYLHNEKLRAAGEQPTHNPVRAIAPGKHSLKQLVNSAQNQKEALEESFAKGKNNRAEASSRYGW